MTQSGLRLGRTALLMTVASGVIGMLKKLPISVARSKKIAVLEPTSRLPKNPRSDLNSVSEVVAY
jgi:hypothetical protein